MLFLHEVHEVVGAREADFEAAFRDGWMRGLASGHDARLLYFLRHALGTGASYRIVTITAVRDGNAWQRLAARVESGDLAAWARHVDTLRHEVRGKMLTPLPWSRLQDVALEGVPVTPAEHAPTLFMEDTVWPFEGQLESYIERAGTHYANEMRKGGDHVLTVDGSLRTLLGGHRRREIILWQKVVRPDLLLPLLTHELPAHLMLPGSWMHDALDLRDQWESRLLRAAPWSPWY